MNELSTIEGLPGWEALPAEERLKVRKLHAACREIAAAPNKMAAYKLAAQAMKDAGHPMSWQSVQRKFLAWQTSGSLLALADLRMAGMRPTRARVKHPGFVAYWTELQTRCQRNGGQAYPLLLDIWRKKSEVIPGYEGWPGHPQIPVGWSKKNLMRIKPAALEARVMREGIKAAAPLLPMVLTTRVGMEAGEYYVSDDNWVDTHVICGKQIVRPLQLGCLDIATGKMVHWGMMPRMMRQDGTHAGLTERYMRMFVAGLLANVGINTSRGTTLVVENGTAAIRAHMEQVLLDLFDGAVKVHRSGMEGKTQALLRGYEGRQGGNPRGKAHLESVWNLTANIWSSCLPAPSGHDRTEPEWLAGLMKEQKALLKKQGYLEIRDPDRAAMLRHLMPTFEQLTTDIAWRVYDAFNSRTDHALAAIRPDLLLGRRLSIAGANPAWLDMRTVIQGVTVDLSAGNTYISTGVPDHLSLQSMVDRQQQLYSNQAAMDDRDNQDQVQDNPALSLTYDSNARISPKAPTVSPRGEVIWSSATPEPNDYGFRVQLEYNEDGQKTGATITPGKIMLNGRVLGDAPASKDLPMMEGEVWLNLILNENEEITGMAVISSAGAVDPFMLTSIDGSRPSRLFYYSFPLAVIKGDEVIQYALGTIQLPVGGGTYYPWGP